jgi:hypothetical protein
MLKKKLKLKPLLLNRLEQEKQTPLSVLDRPKRA